ncbi:MAG: hypothetical protein EZS28_003395 [Streblomastix strix]|uniref:Uncharacterized protein n=1 Tax=Streblomastix strix TaxID=222440 RepID=A0A5J4X1I8_9EUKA|nr:MAG: hypothetical protein EZS28_003395 [Streblomastix strix]
MEYSIQISQLQNDVNKYQNEGSTFLPSNRQASLQTQQHIPPATVTQPGARKINIFSTDDEILSQNAETSRSQLITPAMNAQLVAGGAVELLGGLSADQIQLWTNVTTQAQLEYYTIRSLLAADLKQRLAAPILETGLPASARNMDKILHDLQSQLIVAWRLVVLVLTHVLDFQPRETFVDTHNLLARLWHQRECADRADKYGRKLGVTHADDGHGPTYDSKKFINAVQYDKLAPNSCQACPNTSYDHNKNTRQSIQCSTGKFNRSGPYQTRIAEFSNSRGNQRITLDLSILNVSWTLWNLTLRPVQPVQHIVTVYTGSASLELLYWLTQITIYQGIKSLSVDQLLRIVHSNRSNTSVTTVITLTADPITAQLPELQLDQQQAQIHQQIEQQQPIQPPLQEIHLLQQPQVYQLQPFIFPYVKMQTSGPIQPPVQPTQSAQMFQLEQTLNRLVIQHIADTIQRGRDMDRH